MRILHLTNKPIFPLVDGGCVAMYRFAQLLLNEEHDLKSLSIATSKHPFRLETYPSEMHVFQPEAVHLKTEVTVFGAAKHLINGKSYHLSRFVSDAFSQTLKRILSEHNYDLIVCESIFLLPYLPAIRLYSNAKVLVRTHNAEFKIWSDLRANSNFPKSWYLGSLSKSLKKEELFWLKQVDGILAITEEDADTFRKNGIDAPIEVIPVSIPPTGVESRYSEACFHHIGSMNWQPNLEAVLYLVDVLFPKIRQQLPDAQLHLAGSFFPDTIKSNTEKGIVVHGFVSDAQSFICEHGIQLVPLRSGSGVRIKLLESMSCGAPVVTTLVGAAGLKKDAEAAVKIAPDDDSFVKHAVDLAKNAELRRELGTAAKQFVATHYSPENVKQTLFEFIRSIS